MIRSLALTVTLALAGCASLQQQLEPPDVRLIEVRLEEMGLLEQRYGVTLRVQNPNGISLPIEGVTYEIRLAGTRFAEGQTPRKFSVPARGESEVDFEVSTNLLATLGYLSRWLDGQPQQLDYEVIGEVAIDLPFVKPIPFTTTGAVQLGGDR